MVHLLVVRFETVLNRLGATSAMVWSSNQRSVHNSIFSPLPTMSFTATLKRAWSFRGTWIGRPAHGLEGFVFCAHNQRILSA